MDKIPLHFKEAGEEGTMRHGRGRVGQQHLESRRRIPSSSQRRRLSQQGSITSHFILISLVSHTNIMKAFRRSRSQGNISVILLGAISLSELHFLGHDCSSPNVASLVSECVL